MFSEGGRMYRRVMDEILSGLTGDEKKDKAYLVEKVRAYRHHRAFPFVRDVCMRLLAKDEKILKMQLEQKLCTPYALLEEADFQMFSGHMRKAGALYKALVTYATEEAEKEKEDAPGGLLLDFTEEFDEKLYKRRYRPKVAPVKSRLPYAEICTAYGNYFEAVEAYEKASEWMLRALKWNPVSAEAVLKYAETLWLMGDLESFRHMTVEAFSYAYRPEQISACYRNFGCYEAEKQRYQEASVCYMLASLYNQPDAEERLEYIAIRAEGHLGDDVLQAEEVSEIVDQLGVPDAPDADILDICIFYIRYFHERGDLLEMRYYMDILAGLTGDEQLRKELQDVDSLLFDLG